MSENAKKKPLYNPQAFVLSEQVINITDGDDSGNLGIHKSRFKVPAQHVYIPIVQGSVKDDPLVGVGASIAIGTDNIATDPDNTLDTQAITALDAENDCLATSFGTAIVNNTNNELPWYYNITGAPITQGKLCFSGLMFEL